MPLFTIIRVYEVPAHNRYEATDELMEALELKQEKAYHVKDVVRAPNEKGARLLTKNHRQNGARFSSGKLPATGEYRSPHCQILSSIWQE
jgi:hypothetical protein